MNVRTEIVRRPDCRCTVKLRDGVIHFADVLRSKGSVYIEVYPRSDQESWIVPAGELESLLRDARAELSPSGSSESTLGVR